MAPQMDESLASTHSQRQRLQFIPSKKEALMCGEMAVPASTAESRQLPQVFTRPMAWSAPSCTPIWRWRPDVSINSSRKVWCQHRGGREGHSPGRVQQGGHSLGATHSLFLRLWGTLDLDPSFPTSQHTPSL